MKLSVLLLLLVSFNISSAQDYQIIRDAYTFQAMESGSQGKIYVRFVISGTGQILDDSVKALNVMDGLELVAEKVVRNAPDWKAPKKPGRPDGTTVFVLPINFRLDALTDEDWSQFHKIKGMKLMDSRPEDAIASLQQSIELDKKNGESYYLLGQLFARQSNTEDAEKCFELARRYGYSKQ
ncbi:MAG: energy transducer TonB [Cyclobacteriaceae bacterium]|jgi:tetratricopeptide (TPR) repeat protein